MSKATKTVTEKKKGRLTTTHKILIGGFAVVIALVCAIGYFLLKPEEDTKGGSLVVDESNLEDLREMVNNKEPEGMFEVNMNTVWHFENGSVASSDAYLANGTANNLPLSFEIIVDNEVVYTSTVIPVGNRIKDIVLDKDLDAGTYSAVCQYTLWNEDGTEDSSFGVNIQLVIEN